MPFTVKSLIVVTKHGITISQQKQHERIDENEKSVADDKRPGDSTDTVYAAIGNRHGGEFST